MTHAMLKGANVPLDASAVRAVLRWTPGPGIPDVDASALLVGSDGRVRADEDFVFYNHVRHPSGLVRKLSKKRIPEGNTDTVVADLSSLALDASVDRVVVAASLDVESFEGATFEHVRDLRILLYDATVAGAEPLAVFDVKPETGEETAVICGEVYRRGEGWKFRAVGQGYPTGLIGLATQFGVSVDESEAAEGADAARPEPAEGAGSPSAPSPAGEPVTQAAPPTSSPARPAYGYPHPAPPQPQSPPAYGYPQSASTQPAYGYPQPAAAAAHAPDPNFRLPPMGPQFIRG
ncbi:TerD family protein [Streptomyces sp. CA-294286]|uniref:TerD family protein n=1 Tax=Streptomyces sp. CA-294286 TaxID=3240070 RepID=UPI003D9312DD